MSEQTPYQTMVRHLTQLRAALVQNNIKAHITELGRSRVLVRISWPARDIACRTNVGDGHRYWFWDGDQPICPADNIEAAVDAIRKRTPAGGTAR